MGVGRRSRAVSLGDVRDLPVQTMGFDFDEFDRLISEGTSEAERLPWDLVVDPVTGELVERDTLPMVLEVERGWRNHPRYAVMTDEQYERAIEQEVADVLAEIRGENRAEMGLTAEDQANLSETVERILTEQERPVHEPWSDDDLEFVHTGIWDEVRYGRSSEQPSVFTNPNDPRWAQEVAAELREQTTPSGWTSAMGSSDRSQGLSDDEIRQLTRPGGFTPSPPMRGSFPGAPLQPPRLPDVGGFDVAPPMSGTFPGAPITGPQKPTILSMAGGGQESLPGMSPEEEQYDINRRGIDEARRILEEARRRAEEKAKEPRPAGPPPQQGPPIPPRPDQLDAIRYALLAAGVGGAGMGAMRTFGGGGILGGLGSGMSLR